MDSEFKIDSEYVSQDIETRTLFGLTLEQKKNDAIIEEKLFSGKNVVSVSKPVFICLYLFQ